MWRPSKRQWHLHAWLLAILAAVFALVWRAPPYDPFTGLASYLPLHTTLETFSFVISFLVFGVVWNAYARERAGNLVILACVFLAVGLIDFLHTLSYKGMPVFITPGDPEKAINFWLAARTLAAAGLLFVALRPWRPLTHPGQRYAWLAGALALTALVAWIGLFHQDALPHTFIEGKGLTPFKIGAEYVLVALFGGAAALFLLRARRGAPYDAAGLFTAAVVSVLSELSFTLYSDVTDVFNLLGHVYKVIAYGFIYRAVFVESVHAPFRQVQEAEARYRAVAEDMPVLLCRFLPDGTLTFVNDAYCRYFGKTREELLGHSWVPLVPEEDREYVKRRFGALNPDHPVVAYEHRVVIPGGEVRWQRWIDRAVFEGEHLVEYQSIGEDITERRRAEAALREAEERYRGIFAGARDGIVLIDIDTGLVADCNPEFERQCDRPLAQLKGMRIWELRPPEMREAARAKFEEVRAMGSGGSAELALQRPDGAVVPVEFVSTRVRIGGREYLQSICRDITERKRAEELLRESEARYRTLAENLPGIVYRVYVRENNRMQFFNRTATEVTGYAAEELVAGDICSLDPLIVSEDRERVIATVERAIAENRPFTVEYRLRHKSGDIRLLLEQGTPILGPDGKPLYIDGVVFDVTERKRAKEEISRTKELLERMFESIHVLVAYMDRDFNFIRVNRAYAAADGRTPEFFPGKNHFTLYPGKEVEAIFRRVVETGEPYVAIERPFEYAEHPERGVSYWDWRVEPVRAANGQVEGVIFSLLNVTERVQARQALTESEEKFRSISASAQDAVIMLDDAGQIVYWNPAAERTFGYSADEILGREAHALLAPARFQEDSRRGWAHFRGTGEGPVIGKVQELSALRKDGAEFPIELSVSALKLKGKWHAVGILRDITARRRTEEALRENSQILERIFDTTHFCVVYLDRDFNFIRVNRAYAKACGYPPEFFPGKNHFQLYPGAEVEGIFRRVVQTGEPFTILARPFEFPDHPEWGVTYWDWTLHPLKAPDGRVEALLFVLLDVTERARADIALRRLNRALKTLSAGNEVLVRAPDEAALLQEMCRVIVELGGYRMAWVGFDGSGAPEKLRPVAKAGHDDGFLDILQSVWAGPQGEQLPTIRALRAGTPQMQRHLDAASLPPVLAPWRGEALKRGYRACLALPLLDHGRAFGVLDIFAADAEAFDDEEIRLLQELATDLAYGIVNLRARQERHKGEERLRENLVETIRAIALTVEKRDPYTAGHQQRVSELCVAIARELGLAPERIEGLRLGALIHDIGKVYIPAEILNRPGRLTGPEFEMIKSHPQVGYDIVKDVKFPWPVAQMILQHHERLDGSGYPSALQGEAIIFEARILAVADVVEAMSSHRPYRPVVGVDKALAEIEANRGKLFDPAVVDACARLFREKGFRFG